MSTRDEAARIMEEIYSDAFEKAKGWRKDNGVTGDGKRKPPVSYKMTLWFRPWHYQQLCSDANAAGVSVTKYMQEKLTDPRLKAFLPTRENQKLWRQEEKGEVTSLRKARMKKQQRLIESKAVMGEIIPPGKRYQFARARRAAGLRG